MSDEQGVVHDAPTPKTFRVLLNKDNLDSGLEITATHYQFNYRGEKLLVFFNGADIVAVLNHWICFAPLGLA